MHDPLQQFSGVLPNEVDPAELWLWARMEDWSQNQAISLALGADPDSMEVYLFKTEIWKEDDEIICMWNLLFRLTSIRFFKSEVVERRVKPAEFVAWLEQKRLPCPNDLKVALLDFGVPNENWRKRAESAERALSISNGRISQLEKAIADSAINTNGSVRERDTLLKLFIGMAVEQYAYDPKPSRSPVAAQIAGDVASTGLSVDEDTIRKYLKLGAELLPGETE